MSYVKVWEPVKNFEGLYWVSELGEIKSTITGKVLKHANNTYPSVSLCKSGKVYSKLVHRLVAEAHIPNPENKPQVNHLDGDKKNCHANNLEWVTQSENRIHAQETGLVTFRFDDDHWGTKAGIREQHAIKTLYETGDWTQKELGNLFGLDQSQVSRIINNKRLRKTK